MTALLVAILLLVAAAATAVVFTRDIRHQPVGVGAFGLVLALMFMLFQAPDVALSQLVVGAVALPLMLLLTLATLRRDAEHRRRQGDAAERQS